ncbi:MAG: leucine-rich repeat protein [Lactobacillales bacterium]|jgi:hypothetical protein|nr:leucine-rich repeat protein [Lactobacillales bacterium]
MSSVEDSLKYIQKSYSDYTLGEFITDLHQLQSISKSEELDLETLDKISGGVMISKPFLFKAVATTAGILALPLFTGGQTKVHATPVVEKAASTEETTQNNIKYKLNKPLSGFNTAQVIGADTERVTIPETVIVRGVTYYVAEIDEKAFYENKKIKEVEIPRSIKIIGKKAFTNCQNLTAVTFAGNSQLTKIKFGAFTGCSNLKHIDIPRTVGSIGACAFALCSNLASVTFTEDSQLTRIERSAFKECKSLGHIDIPKTVETIGRLAFAKCENLEEILFAGDVSRITIAENAVKDSNRLLTAVPLVTDTDDEKTKKTTRARAYSSLHHKYQELLQDGKDRNEVVREIFESLKSQFPTESAEKAKAEKDLVSQLFMYCVFHDTNPVDSAVTLVELADKKESAASKITAVTYKVSGLQEIARNVRQALDDSGLLTPDKMKRRMALEDIRVKSKGNWQDTKKNGTLDVASLPAGISIVEINDKQNENVVRYEQSDPLFETAPSPKDIRQGCIGDCFLLSSISATLAQDENIIINSMRQTDDGKVIVRLWHFDKTQSQASPDYYKVEKTTFKNQDGQMVGNSKPWVNIFIKAFVAHAARYPAVVNHASQNVPIPFTEIGFDYYEYISGGISHDSMAAIIGNFKSHGRIMYTRSNLDEVISEGEALREMGSYSSEAKIFFNNIKSQLNSGNTLTAAGADVVMDSTAARETKGYMGFRHNHQYAILTTLENQTTKDGVDRKLNLIQIQNPWGEKIPHYEKGADNKWRLADADTNLGTDGICWTDLNDFLRFFESIDYCRLNNNSDDDDDAANQIFQNTIRDIKNRTLKLNSDVLQADIDWLLERGYIELASKINDEMLSLGLLDIVNDSSTTFDIYQKKLVSTELPEGKDFNYYIQLLRDRGYDNYADEVEKSIKDKTMEGLKNALLDLTYYDIDAKKLVFINAEDEAKYDNGIAELRNNGRDDLVSEVEKIIEKIKYAWVEYVSVSAYYDIDAGGLVFFNAEDEAKYNNGIAELRSNSRDDLADEIQEKVGRSLKDEKQQAVEEKAAKSLKSQHEAALRDLANATNISAKIFHAITAQIQALTALTSELTAMNLDSMVGDANTAMIIYENIKNSLTQIDQKIEEFRQASTQELKTKIENLKSSILTKIDKTANVMNEGNDMFLQQTYGYNYKIVEMNQKLKDLVNSVLPAE